jgi:hypothetical protein
MENQMRRQKAATLPISIDADGVLKLAISHLDSLRSMVPAALLKDEKDYFEKAMRLYGDKRVAEALGSDDIPF